MPRSTIGGKLDLSVDLGDPFLNRVADGFLKIGTVAVAKAAVEETYHVVNRGSVSKHDFEHSLKKMCKDGAYWGTVAGVYIGLGYGVEKVRGTRDWKNAMVCGALTGAVVSTASKNDRDRIVLDAITGGAVATAAEFLSYLT